MTELEAIRAEQENIHCKAMAEREIMSIESIQSEWVNALKAQEEAMSGQDQKQAVMKQRELAKTYIPRLCEALAEAQGCLIAISESDSRYAPVANNALIISNKILEVEVK